MKNSTKVMAIAAMFGGFAMTANAVEVVKTVDLACTQTVAEGYAVTNYDIDTAVVFEALGIESLEDAEVVSLDAEGAVLDQTGNNGYWYNADGEVCGYGDGAAWFIEYQGEEDAWSLGNMPGLASAEGKCNIGFMNEAEEVVLYNVTVTLEAVDYGETEIVAEYDMEFSNKPNSGYATAALPFNSAEVKKAIGCEALTAEMLISLDEDGNIVTPNANGIGYWYGYDGTVTPWGSDAAWWIEVNDAEDATEFLVGNYPDCEEAEGECNIGFLNDGMIYLFNVAVTINPDAEYTGVESLVSNANVVTTVYNLQGVKVGNDLNGLAKGIYIVNGKKVVIK